LNGRSKRETKKRVFFPVTGKKVARSDTRKKGKKKLGRKRKEKEEKKGGRAGGERGDPLFLARRRNAGKRGKVVFKGGEKGKV